MGARYYIGNKGKDDVGANKRNKTKSFRYVNNIIIITKVKN